MTRDTSAGASSLERRVAAILERAVAASIEREGRLVVRNQSVADDLVAAEARTRLLAMTPRAEERFRDNPRESKAAFRAWALGFGAQPTGEQIAAILEMPLPYKYKRTSLQPVARAILDAKAAVMLVYPDWQIGLTDSTSDRRIASFAKAYLVSRGVDRKRIYLSPPNRTQRIREGADYLANAQRRQVTFRIIPRPK